MLRLPYVADNYTSMSSALRHANFFVVYQLLNNILDFLFEAYVLYCAPYPYLRSSVHRSAAFSFQFVLLVTLLNSLSCSDDLNIMIIIYSLLPMVQAFS